MQRMNFVLGTDKKKSLHFITKHSDEPIYFINSCSERIA